MPRALIFGATGQDGQFLADFLLSKGYEVLGTSRSRLPFESNPLNLQRPKFETLDISNGVEVQRTLNEFMPDEIYNLAGESSVSRSFENPSLTVESNVVGLVNILSALREIPRLSSSRVFQASSAEMFGSQNAQLNEESPFNPVSPYAVSKLAAHKISLAYRNHFGCWVSCGILFNHESELRPETFVFQKIITSAVAISKGKLAKLTLGNIDVSRDWGYSREYVEAMWRVLQADRPDDYIIATGEKHSIKDLIELTFRILGIESKIDVSVNFSPSLARPTDVASTWGNPQKIERELGWKANTKFEKLVEILVDYQLNKVFR